jgi:hypothetical protein
MFYRREWRHTLHYKSYYGGKHGDIIETTAIRGCAGLRRHLANVGCNAAGWMRY